MILLCVAAFAAQPLIAQDEDSTGLTWPRELEFNDHTITLYQPELEDYTDDKLEGRLAVSVKKNAEEGLTFGALRFVARIETDRQERLVFLKEVDITDARFPDGDEDKIKELTTFLEGSYRRSGHRNVARPDHCQS